MSSFDNSITDTESELDNSDTDDSDITDNSSEEDEVYGQFARSNVKNIESGIPSSDSSLNLSQV